MAISVCSRAVAIAACLVLTGCGGGSGSNPFGSFGSIGSLNPFGGRDDVGTGTTPARVNDGTVLVETIEQVVPEAALRGVILRATVIAATEGYHSARFVGRNDGVPNADGIVTYELRAVPPEDPGVAGPLNARRILVATFIPDTDLDVIRGFRIVSRSRTVDIGR